MNWSFLVLLVFVYVIDCEGRGKRQLFREDIPHNRPLDGSYNQRPQGEGSQPGLEGVIPGDPSYPVRFEAQDAIMGSRLPPPPPPEEQQFNPYHHHQPSIHTGPSSTAPNSYPSGIYPQQQQQYHHQTHQNHHQTHQNHHQNHHHNDGYPLNPPPPPPPTGPYHHISGPPPQYPINSPPLGPNTSPFETRLRALWNLNYDNGGKNNGAVANMVVSLDNRPKKGKAKSNKRRKMRTRPPMTQAEEHLSNMLRLSGQSVRVGSSGGTQNGQSTGGMSNSNPYINYGKSLNGASIVLNGRQYANLNGYNNNGQQQQIIQLSNPLPFKSNTAAVAATSLLNSSKGNLQFQQAVNQ